MPPVGPRWIPRGRTYRVPSPTGQVCYRRPGGTGELVGRERLLEDGRIQCAVPSRVSITGRKDDRDPVLAQVVCHSTKLLRQNSRIKLIVSGNAKPSEIRAAGPTVFHPISSSHPTRR